MILKYGKFDRKIEAIKNHWDYESGEDPDFRDIENSHFQNPKMKMECCTPISEKVFGEKC